MFITRVYTIFLSSKETENIGFEKFQCWHRLYVNFGPSFLSSKITHMRLTDIKAKSDEAWFGSVLSGYGNRYT